jgi:hypothetical protein
MSNRLLQTLVMLALSGACATALADDPPSLVGRVALAQGQVSVSGGGMAEPGAAQVNWPVTAGQVITTARGARTELQVGAVFIRLDGDSSLEVAGLDEDNLRLRLHYGSASIRIADRDMLDAFELSTPEGRVRMQEPGRIRVDAERIADTSSVTVFDGVAHVEGGGASLTVRAGKRADLQDDDVRTVAARRDAFDDWAQARDNALQAPAAARYVSTDMTGYADLDRYGSWRSDPEYGTVWAPAAVGPNWVPYSDGSWVWFEPWGWTWVDNAPWGYAPFHYGRWVYVNHRWCWAPGRREHRSVWSPALVGWVGGAGWSAGFKFNNRHQALPARGWYPLSPHERFEPTYRLSDERLRRLNHDVRPDYRHRWDEHRRAGLTIVPQAQFSQLGRVAVSQVPRASVPAKALGSAPNAAPPAPPQRARDWRQEPHRGDERTERTPQQWREHDRGERRGDERGHEQGPRAAAPGQPQQAGIDRRWEQRPGMVLSAPPAGQVQEPQQQRPAGHEHRQPPQPVIATSMPPAQPAQPQPAQPAAPRPAQQPPTVLSAPPAQPGQQQLPPQRLQWRMEHRERGEERGEREHQLSPAPGPVPAGVAAAPVQAPAPAQAERHERPRGAEAEFERHRGMMQPAPQPAPLHIAPPEVPVPAHMPPPAPAPVRMPPPPAAVSQPAPPPQPMARPAPAAAPGPAAAASAPHGHGRRGDDNPRQQER